MKLFFQQRKLMLVMKCVVHIGYSFFPKDVKKDEKVLVDDGKLILKY